MYFLLLDLNSPSDKTRLVSLVCGLLPVYPALGFVPSVDWREGQLSFRSLLAAHAGDSLNGVLHLFRGYDHHGVFGPLLCVLAVPGWLEPQKFLDFISAARSALVHAVLVSDAVPNRYLSTHSQSDLRDAPKTLTA